MARRKNYGFEKRQREQRKQKKKREKAERRGLTDSTVSEGGRADEDKTPKPDLRDQD